jgi:hypothetical protein
VSREQVPSVREGLPVGMQVTLGRRQVPGWIAQDSGDPVNANRLTRRAEDHARAADPALRAMISMRRSNILLTVDPKLAMSLAAGAGQVIRGRSVGRLAASIARQQALAAIANHDQAGFLRQAAHALEDSEAAQRDECSLPSVLAVGWIGPHNGREREEWSTRNALGGRR